MPRSGEHGALVDRLRRGDSYGLLLLAIVVAYALSAVCGRSAWAGVVVTVAFGCVLLLALHTSHARGRSMRVVAVFVVVAVLMAVAHAATGTRSIEVAGYTSVLLGFAAPVVVLRRIARHPVVNVETILGAIDAYLLVGIAFAALYGAMDALGTHDFFAQGPTRSAVDFLYFSFVVLTTLGFGDLTPATSLGRVTVTLEALLGQMFLVTVVAALVANIGRARAVRRDDDGGA
jgi:hypothetical protein